MSDPAFHNQFLGTEALAEPSQQVLAEIADKTQAVVDMFASETDTYGNVWASATSEEAWEDARFGQLVVGAAPRYDPGAFLEIRRLDLKYGDDPREAERVYTLSRQLSDKLEETLSLKVSDAVSLLEAVNLIAEEGAFFQSLDGKPVDGEMLQAATADMMGKLYETFALAGQELGLSLSPAHATDAEQLLELLSFALSKDQHEQPWGYPLTEWREHQKLVEKLLGGTSMQVPRWRRLGRRILSALRHS